MNSSDHHPITPHTAYTSLLQEHVSLADKNWFNTGGTSRFFCEPTTPEQFQWALQYAQEQKLTTFLLGKGANILISDTGFAGMTIRPCLNVIQHMQDPDNMDKVLVNAGAGVDLATLINYCLEHNIIGLEEFSGIPSTVGGAVYINLHYFEFLLEHFLSSAQVIDAHTYQLYTVDRNWFNFGYNYSRLHERNHYLVEATFRLNRVSSLETAHARGRQQEIIRHRQSRYPHKNTCGSFFRNFYENEVTMLTADNKKMIFVAFYLDKLGVKGNLAVGDAIVSHQHANMIVNRGSATTHDIVTLARTMQQMVRDAFNIIPQPECQLIGFTEYPLL